MLSIFQQEQIMKHSLFVCLGSSLFCIVFVQASGPPPAPPAQAKLTPKEVYERLLQHESPHVKCEIVQAAYIGLYNEYEQLKNKLDRLNNKKLLEAGCNSPRSRCGKMQFAFMQLYQAFGNLEERYAAALAAKTPQAEAHISQTAEKQ